MSPRTDKKVALHKPHDLPQYSVQAQTQSSSVLCEDTVVHCEGQALSPIHLGRQDRSQSVLSCVNTQVFTVEALRKWCRKTLFAFRILAGSVYLFLGSWFWGWYGTMCFLTFPRPELPTKWFLYRTKTGFTYEFRCLRDLGQISRILPHWF